MSEMRTLSAETRFEAGYPEDFLLHTANIKIQIFFK